ncbi:MAG TPA: flavodoxin domain-containing protein [Ktedonobacteraceae bacterium]|nr:flavodoxin domain-containing protein [Ktedonobacteraceae bacterium]
MATTVLVAYATKYGSTQEVAEVIATTLREHGLEVEVRPAHEVRTLQGYDSVVLGAALYIGRWHADARRFLKRYRAVLSDLPVAIFALGPLDASEKQWLDARTQLNEALAKEPWLTPVNVEMFGGVINPAKLHFPFNHMPAGDARNWTAIRSFAERVAAALQRTVPEPAAALLGSGNAER